MLNFLFHHFISVMRKPILEAINRRWNTYSTKFYSFCEDMFCRKCKQILVLSEKLYYSCWFVDIHIWLQLNSWFSLGPKATLLIRHNDSKGEKQFLFHMANSRSLCCLWRRCSVFTIWMNNICKVIHYLGFCRTELWSCKEKYT